MKKLLGSNIRSGQQPGGMASTTFDAKPRIRRSDTLGLVHEAAASWLRKRGFGNQISSFEASAINYPRPSL